MDTVIYRGYRICSNLITGLIWVEKDGCRISWAESVDAARRIIDTLLD